MIHHVFANKSNIGDWLSARAIQALLAPAAVTEYFCDEPFVPETLERLAKVAPEDLIIIGGGGLFMDYFTPFWEGFHDIAKRMPFCIWGVGYCDMKREESRPPQKLLEEIVRASRLCVVRDELTRSLLQPCHIPSPVACPTMSLIETLPLGHGVLHVDAYDNVGSDIYEMMDLQAKEFAAKTERSFRAINNTIPGGSEAALFAMLELYAKADLILTGRLHGCIIGLAMGRKVLAVSGDRKVDSFMESAGLSDWVLDLKDIERLPARLCELPAQETPLAFVEEARRSNRRVAEKVRKVIESSQDNK